MPPKLGPAAVSSVRFAMMVVPTAMLVAPSAGLVLLTAGARTSGVLKLKLYAFTGTPALFLMESAGMVTVYTVSFARFAAGSIVSTFAFRLIALSIVVAPALSVML